MTDTFTALARAYQRVLGVAADVPMPERAHLSDAAKAVDLHVEDSAAFARHMAINGLDEDLEWEEWSSNMTSRCILSMLVGIQLERDRKPVS